MILLLTHILIHTDKIVFNSSTVMQIQFFRNIVKGAGLQLSNQKEYN